MRYLILKALFTFALTCLLLVSCSETNCDMGNSDTRGVEPGPGVTERDKGRDKNDSGIVPGQADNSSAPPVPEQVSLVTYGDPKAIAAIRKCYLTGFHHGALYDLEKFHDPRVLGVYVDVQRIEGPLMDEAGYLLLGLGEVRGYLDSIVEKFTGQFFYDLPEWYCPNKPYIYWDRKDGCFKVDAQAKKKQTPIDPISRKPLTKAQVQEMTALEKEFEGLLDAAYHKLVTEIREARQRKRQGATRKSQ